MKWILQLFLALLGAGCATDHGPRASSVMFHVPDRIAILPLENQSTDLQGADFIRVWIFYQMQTSGYALESMEIVDRGLSRLGISDAGQLPSVSMQALQAELKAPAAVYGELREFKRGNVGIYSKDHIELKLRLVELATGRILWECEDKIEHGMVAPPNRVADYFVEGLARRWLDLLNNTPMQNEVVRLTRRMVKTLPRPDYGTP